MDRSINDVSTKRKLQHFYISTVSVLISSVRHSSHFYNDCRKRLVGCMMSPPVYRTRTEMYRLQHSLVAASFEMAAGFGSSAFLSLLVKVKLRKILLDISALFVNHHENCVIWENEESFSESSRCLCCTILCVGGHAV